MKKIICGTEVHYRITGKGTSMVLLLHGWGCNMEMMQPVADALEQDHRIMMIDFPGHGKSGRPPEPWGVPEFASCVETLMEKEHFFPCSVIAHSFGCRVATWLENKRPDMFNRIVFTGAAGIRPIPTEESKRRTDRYKKLKGYCKAIEKIPIAGSIAGKWEEKLRQKYGSRDYNALDDEMRKTFIKVISQDLSGMYNQFRASTLLVWGDNDTETPLWMAKEMCSRIPDAGLVIFEGGSHFAYLEQLQRFNTIICHFLKGDE